MSSRRSRSGGTAIRMTSSRYSRSSRNRPAADFLPQIAVGRRDDPHVHAPGQVLADAAQLAFLNHAQHLGLGARRQLADLVEEQRAAVRFFEHARPLGNGAGERAARVAEKLGFDEIVGQRRAVQRAERAIAPRTAAMHRARDQFFAAAALAFDEDGKRRRAARARSPRRSSTMASLTPRRSLVPGATDRDRRTRRADRTGAAATVAIVRISAARERSSAVPSGQRTATAPSV